MPNKFSPQELQAEEWLTRAGDDELNARSILTHRDGAPGGVCFLAHQMSEKLLKAFLVAKKNWFPKIHYLDKLTELCGEVDSSFNKVKEAAASLDSFYTPSRYPGDYPEFSWKDAEGAFRAAMKIKALVVRKLKKK